MPLLICFLLGWIVISSLRGKSTTEVFADAYYWVVGQEAPNRSRAELQSIIDIQQEQMDSLSQELTALKNKSPYRTALVKTVANSLNLRSEPNLSSEVVIKIPDSSAVKILYFDEEVLMLDGVPGQWCKVKYADKEGWVWGNYLEILD